MTTDERLDRLTERHEALTHNVEMLTVDLRGLTGEVRDLVGEVRELAGTVDKLLTITAKVSGNVDSLVLIVTNHQQRLDRIKGLESAAARVLC